MCKYLYIICSAILIGAANGEVDCSKRPDLKSVKSCCKIPVMNWKSFQNQCGRQSVVTQRAPSPCFVECAFNISNALNGDDLNLANVREMLSKLFDKNPDFVEAFAKSFEKCAPIVSQRIAEFKSKQKGSSPKGMSTSSCPLVGSFYAMCAHQNVVMSCPPSAWTSTPACEAAREYAITCEPKLGGPGGRRGVSSQGQRGGQRMGRGRREAPLDETFNFGKWLDFSDLY